MPLLDLLCVLAGDARWTSLEKALSLWLQFKWAVGSGGLAFLCCPWVLRLAARAGLQLCLYATLHALTFKGQLASAQVAVTSPHVGCHKPQPGCRHWCKPAPCPGILHLCPCGRAECAALEGAHHRCGHTSALQSRICRSCCLAARVLKLCAALQAPQTRHTAMAALSSTCG